jgi:rubrerythrin
MAEKRDYESMGYSAGQTSSNPYAISMSDLMPDVGARWRICRHCGTPTADESRSKCEWCGGILPIDYVYSKEVPRR